MSWLTRAASLSINFDAMFESLTKRLSSAVQSLRGERSITEKNVEEGLEAVRQALLEADVHFKVATDLIGRVRDSVLGEEVGKGMDASQRFIHAVHLALVDLMGPEDAELDLSGTAPVVILMAGLQGAGKTTTSAKLARFLRDKRNRKPLLVAADVKRPAAVEQLKVLGKQLDIPVFHQEGIAPDEVCARGVESAKLQGYDTVILDTAGRLHIDSELMDELGRIVKRTSPRNQLLVADSMTGQDAVRSAQAFHEQLDLTGVVLTKLDGDARGGAAVSLKAVTGRPIVFIGTGEKLEDLDTFSPERMAGRILGMGDVVGLVEKAQESIDETEAQASFEKMVMGSFTLEDLLGQIRMIQKLGPMKKVLGMMPGMGGMMDKLDFDDNHMQRLEALFLSMTPRERLLPSLLDMSRRRRVARGAGQEVGAVNQLLKMHKGMGQMMKKMGMGGKLGGKAKKQALAGLSPDGNLAASDLGGGMLGGLGDMAKGLGGMAKGLGGLAGLGGSTPDMSGLGGFGGAGGAGMPDIASMMGGSGPKPMGSSATRKSGSKRKQKKNKRKGRKK
ncbi:MAG: signal recognition particle subunit SRP54 [Planctomycetota bacterium]